MSTGILFAFCATFCWAITAFLFTKAGRLMSAVSMNLFRLLLGLILVFIAALLFDNNFSGIFSASFTQGWLWMALSGVVALGIGDYFGLRMYTILSPRFGSVLTTLAPAVALFMGTLLLGEHINLIGLLGMFITIIGVGAMSMSRKERGSIPDYGHGSIRKGIVFGIVSAACNGAALAFSKKGFIEQASIGEPLHPITGSFIRFLSAAFVVVLLMLLKNLFVKNVKNIAAQPVRVLQFAALGVFLGPLLAVSFAMLAIQSIDVAVTQTIFSLVPVITLLIAHFILKEKITRNSLLGVTVAIAGVCILIWRVELGSLIG